MRQVKVGLVGSGFIAELHMHAYRRVFGVEASVRAVVSRGDHVLDFARRFGIRRPTATTGRCSTTRKSRWSISAPRPRCTRR